MKSKFISLAAASFFLLAILVLAPAAAMAQEGEQQVVDEVIAVGSSRVDLQACKLEYSIVSPK